MKLSEYQRSRSFFDLVKGHSDFKVKLFDFGRYTQVSDSGLMALLLCVRGKTPELQLTEYGSYFFENFSARNRI